MTPEDRLRQAMEARASHVEPSADALSRIEEKLMDAQRSDNRKRVLARPGGGRGRRGHRDRRRGLTGDDDEPVSSDAHHHVGVDHHLGVVDHHGGHHHDDDVRGRRPRRAALPGSDDVAAVQRPESAARAFATEFAGFTDPVIGEFQQGDARSGEVEVRGFADGAPSVVLLRQLEDDAWYVIGVSTDSIRLTTPQIGDTLTSPQPLEGQAYAFEGNVQVRLYADGVQEPIGETFVTGRGDGVLGDFTGEIEFTNDTGATHGVLMLLSDERRGRFDRSRSRPSASACRPKRGWVGAPAP